ncbi:thioredoxin domain-containing protein 12-like [Oratosquilla oratoria]|uniref:thioredoxin domain-containing protein 12-like n=1 Tax=Oratosquilla oratoria TaxID=337810 RepID=UPI003F75AB06
MLLRQNALVLIILSLLHESNCENTLARGLGDAYSWVTLGDGLTKAKETGKPLMLIIHKSWCGACKAFKPKFAGSEEAKMLSSHFIMVNSLDNEEPTDPKYAPDGGYIPRILFLDSDGHVHQEIYNKDGNPSYKFYYSDDKTVVTSMKQAIDTLGRKTMPSDEF